MNKAFAITTGDTNGIGFEVAAKALHQIGPQKNINFFIFRNKNQERIQKKFFSLIDKKFVRLTFTSLKSAAAFCAILNITKKQDKQFLFDLCLSESPAQWVVDATLFCKNGFFGGLITGPLSKVETAKLAKKPIGHTGIFRQLFPQHQLNMGFVGAHFHVVLATDHIPLHLVEKNLTKKVIANSIKNALILKKLVKNQSKLQVLALNPHAGEKNLLGSFEDKTLKPILKKYKNIVSSPISPDAAFLKYKNTNKVYLALYHDQGLIPFKMIHGQESGVHITLGLPFIRTSVDHGTATDIFNKNIANFHSMREAIELAILLNKA